MIGMGCSLYDRRMFIRKNKSLSAFAGAKYRTGHRDINRGNFLDGRKFYFLRKATLEDSLSVLFLVCEHILGNLYGIECSTFADLVAGEPQRR